MNSTSFAAMVLFLQLTIQHLQPDVLIFVSDDENRDNMEQVCLHLKHELAVLPIIRISFVAATMTMERNQCHHCRPNNLTILLIKRILPPFSMLPHRVEFVNTRRFVTLSLVRVQTRQRAAVVKDLIVINGVLVEAIDDTQLMVSVGSISHLMGQQLVTTFNSAQALFTSHDPNALAFRYGIRRWPNRPTLFYGYSSLMAPFHFTVYHNHRVCIASYSSDLIGMIARRMGMSLRTLYTPFDNFTESLSPRFVGVGSVSITLTELHVYNRSADYPLYIHASRNKFAIKKIFENRRYVAIVPFRSLETAIGINLLPNVAALLWWIGMAAVFTLVRWVVFRRSATRCVDTMTTMFFTSLAVVLSNAMFSKKSKTTSMAESYLLYVLSTFAMLSSVLFTGAIFKRHMSTETPPQIDTMNQLFASNLSIRECLVEANADNRYAYKSIIPFLVTIL